MKFNNRGAGTMAYYSCQKLYGRCEAPSCNLQLASCMPQAKRRNDFIDPKSDLRSDSDPTANVHGMFTVKLSAGTCILLKTVNHLRIRNVMADDLSGLCLVG